MPYPVTNPAPVIANGASLSGLFYVGDGRLVGVQMPAAWTAASLSFQTSQDGTNFFDLYDNAGNEVVVTASASRQIVLDGFDSGIWMKVRSGTSGTPVNQGAARTLTMTVRKGPANFIR